MTQGDPTVDKENKLVTVQTQRLGGSGGKGIRMLKDSTKQLSPPNSLIFIHTIPKSNYILRNTINTESHYGDGIVPKIVRVGDGANLPSC